MAQTLNDLEAEELAIKSKLADIRNKKEIMKKSDLVVVAKDLLEQLKVNHSTSDIGFIVKMMNEYRDKSQRGKKASS